MASKHFEHLLDAVEKNRVWFNKTFVQAFVPILVATLMLFAADLIVGGPKHLPSWFNWMMFIVFVSLITFSLVISQKRHLVGEYGETILILIPTMVWLVGGKFLAQHLLIIISLCIILIGLFLSAISSIPFTIHRKNRERANFFAQLLMRLSFVCSTTTATVVLSLLLLNWADQTMHFAPHEVNPETKELVGDYSSTAWVMFIAVVTVGSGAVLVLIGLTHSINKHESKLAGSSRKFFQKIYKGYQNRFVERRAKIYIFKRKSLLRKIKTKTAEVKSAKKPKPIKVKELEKPKIAKTQVTKVKSAKTKKPKVKK